MEKVNMDRKAINDYLLTMEGIDPAPLLALAEEAMQGMLVLPGTGAKPVFVGDPPHWDENNYGVGGYTWMLSRLGYMITLCKAFLITKERRYLDKVERDLADWFEKEPAPPLPYDLKTAIYYHGVHNWRMLEVGNRMVFAFPIVLSVLREYGTDKALVERMYTSIAEHAERISLGSIQLWPKEDHNHYTQEINGMLSAASMIQDHPKAAAWIDQAITGLEHACATQLTDDGSQTEGSSGYHNDVVIDFCNSIYFASKCGRKMSDEFVSRVKNALDFAVHILSPDGNILPFGDSETLCFSSVEAAALGFMLFGDPSYIDTLRQFMDSKRIREILVQYYPWSFINIPELLALLDTPLGEDAKLLPTCTYQSQMDQYIVRSDWSRDASILFFSSHSPIHNGSNHAHMDQLGIIFGADGKILLQDPGRFTYMNCEDRHQFKASEYHNLPTVDGRDAFEYRATFEYGPQKDGAITAIMDSERIKGAYGYHDNYEPVKLSRSAALIDNRLLLIADTYENVKDENMKVFFHINSTNVAIEGSSAVTTDDGANIRIISSLPESDISVEILEGRLSDLFYHANPAKRAVFSRKATADTETLIFAAVPFSDKSQDSLKDLAFNDGIITFTYNGDAYRLKYENGIFSF